MFSHIGPDNHFLVGNGRLVTRFVYVFKKKWITMENTHTHLLMKITGTFQVQRFVSPPLTKLFDVDRLCGRLPFLANAYHLRGCSMYRWNEMQFKRAIKYFPHLTCYVNRSFGRNSQTISPSTPKHRTSMCIHGNRARRSQGALT